MAMQRFVENFRLGEECRMAKLQHVLVIRGQARDHSALSRFVRRLFEQPEIQDIRILNTSLADNREFVDFNLAVTVNSNGASS